MPLTDTEVKEMWDSLYRKGSGKEEVKAGTLPSRAQRKAILQAIDDFWEANRLVLKASMDAAAGFALTNAAAKKYGKAWLRYKFGRE